MSPEHRLILRNQLAMMRNLDTTRMGRDEVETLTRLCLETEAALVSVPGALEDGAIATGSIREMRLKAALTIAIRMLAETPLGSHEMTATLRRVRDDDLAAHDLAALREHFEVDTKTALDNGDCK